MLDWIPEFTHDAPIFKDGVLFVRESLAQDRGGWESIAKILVELPLAHIRDDTMACDGVFGKRVGHLARARDRPLDGALQEAAGRPRLLRPWLGKGVRGRSGDSQ